MYVTFTTQARNVMQLAVQEAQRSKHAYVGPGHILLALFTEGTGGAVMTLTNLQLNQRIVRLEVTKFVPPGRDIVGKGMLPQTPEAKRAIEYAIAEAQALQQSSVGTGHLLLGLLHDPDGVATRIFENLDVKVAAVRDEVARHMDDDKSATQIAEGLPPHNAMASESSLPEDWTHLRKSEPTAMQVFFAWDKLRIVYNLVLALIVLAGIGPSIVEIFDEVIVAAICANVAFCAGPFVENYLCWMGGARSVVRWIVFLLGQLVAIGVTVVAVNECPVPKWFWF